MENEKQKEKRLRKEREKILEMSRKKAEDKDRRIHETLLLSERKETERTGILIRKQKEAEKRLEQQKIRQSH